MGVVENKEVVLAESSKSADSAPKPAEVGLIAGDMLLLMHNAGKGGLVEFDRHGRIQSCSKEYRRHVGTRTEGSPDFRYR